MIEKPGENPSTMHDGAQPPINQTRGEIEASRDSEARFRAIFEDAFAGIARVSPDGRILEINRRLCDITGYSQEELLTNTVAVITHPDDLEVNNDQARRLLAGEIGNYTVEKRYVRRSGSIVWVKENVSLTRQPDGSPDYFIFIVVDIPAHGRYEEMLRESEERLRLASMIAGLGVMEWDAQADHAVWQNERMYEIIGRTRADGALTKAQLIERYMHPDDVAAFEQALAEGMRSGRSFHVVYRLRREDGGLRWLALVGSFELAGDGAPARMIGVIRDITEQRLAEAEREQLAQEQVARAVAEAANRSKDELLAMVSHDLRSPLNAILGYTRALQSGIADREIIEKAAAVIERNTKAQLQIIEDLLDSARIVAGKLRIEPAKIDLRPVLEAALDTIGAMAESKGVTLAAHFGPGPEMAIGDPVRLQQVMWNLLTNAVKFTPQGGRVELVMEGDADCIRITVSDTGKGIEPEFLPFVFDRFSQAAPSSDRRAGGLGLGLALVKHLIELHGGTITAASEGAGRGSTFTITLPRGGPSKKKA